MAMKVICDQAALSEALNMAGSVVASRTPSPVLTCVKLTATDGRLRLAATDGETFMVLDLDRVEVDSPGEVLVPADKFTQIVRECNDPTITIEADGHALHIRGADARFKVFGFDPQEAPPEAEFDEDTVDCTINAGVLAITVARSLFAAAAEHTRYAINGVLYHREGKRLRMVATDGRRLALAMADCDAADGEKSCIIPAKALGLLRRLTKDPENSVRVSVGESRIAFRIDSPTAPATLVSSLVEGRFPPFEDVIPKEQDKKLVCNRDLLRSAIRRASLLTTEESRSVRMHFDKDKLTLCSHAPEMGESEVVIDVKNYEGDTVEIGFNPAYIADALKVVDDDEVTIELKASNKPGLIRAGGDFTYVLMPVTV